MKLVSVGREYVFKSRPRVVLGTLKINRSNIFQLISHVHERRPCGNGIFALTGSPAVSRRCKR